MRRDTLLVPLDYTGCAWEVVGTAAELAGRLGMDVVLLYVVQLPHGVSADTVVASPGEAVTRRAAELLDHDARDHLDGFVETFRDAGSRVRVAIRHGDVVEGILGTAAQVGARMIVMGTHGRRGLTRLVEGSVAEAVIRRADCPVTVVRTHEAAELPGPSEAQAAAQAESAG